MHSAILKVTLELQTLASYAIALLKACGFLHECYCRLITQVL